MACQPDVDAALYEYHVPRGFKILTKLYVIIVTIWPH